jgi:hypothetical protein
LRIELRHELNPPAIAIGAIDGRRFSSAGRFESQDRGRDKISDRAS